MKKLILAVAVMGLWLGAQSALATLLSIDFNHSANVSTQPGFQSFAGPVDMGGNTASQTFGAYTVTLTSSGTHASNLGFFNRGTLSNGGAFTYADLYNDFAFINDNFAEVPSIKLSISGLTASSLYSLTLYSYDASGQWITTMNFAPTGNTTGTSGSVTYASANAPTSNSQYGTTLLVSSTTSILDINLTPNALGRDLRLNGFELSLVVPEPSTVFLFGVGGLMLWWRKQRRS